MKGIVFYKMTGSGNDFVMLDGRTTTLAEWPAPRIVDVCDRRLGVGADGLVILTPEGAGGRPHGLLQLRRFPGRHVRQCGALQHPAIGPPRDGAGRGDAPGDRSGDLHDPLSARSRSWPS